jgi:GNAT superfamily N-acetyltransferase
MKPETRALTAADWPLLEELFGERGACGGCWCMTWRVPHGGKHWEEVKGEKNRRAFKELVTSGKAQGVLAFVAGQAVGWCSVDRRSAFARLANMPSLATDWDERTWSITCFFIRSGWRGKGVGTALLRAAVALARERGARRLEGYPARPAKGSGAKMPAAFAWTGLPQMFERARFGAEAVEGSERPVYVRRFR